MRALAAGVLLVFLLPSPSKAAEVRLVSATAYCHGTRTANGERPVYRVTAAMNRSIGTRWRLDVQHSDPYARSWHDVELRINDTGGPSMQFDIAMPGRCTEARRWGRRTILIERVG